MLMRNVPASPPAPSRATATAPAATKERTASASSPERFDGWVRSQPRALLDELVTIDIAACPVTLADEAQALRVISAASQRPHPVPLAVASINLDHVHHFGNGRRPLGAESGTEDGSRVEWLSLIDGRPIARQAQRFTGDDVPRLAGSDLIGGILDDASENRLTVAVLGGSSELTPVLRDRLAEQWPGVTFCGHWAPERAALAEPRTSRRIAEEIRRAGADIVIVCLGKPRQEQWIDSYGSATGAGVLLAFGAVVDFLAGRVSRAPSWISSAGGEWMWRLMLEPRRLARRYLIEGPPAYLAVRRSPAPLRA
ncbi:WecB/TagA/CpsF family glycosyltransferase [Microbacterium sp. P05]|uniref:WecB/TagA/CpsF family glycosyltransferase n=1 Tax=Microbacterium sp. P05 TaxID=3366948 RepID=UPI003746CCD8